MMLGELPGHLLRPLMFESTTVSARVYVDETGIFHEIPVLLTSNGPIVTVVDYLVEHWD